MKNLYFFTLLLSLMILYSSCENNGQYEEILSSHVSDPIDHSRFTELLNQHVDKDGWVNYRGFNMDSTSFNQYLAALSSAYPSTSWLQNEQLAYWINVYNAFTIKVILDHYPVKSITDIKTFHIPLVNTIWHDEVIPIGSRMLSLDYVEHQILRKEFEEPRIHFAINCASVSCPKLRNEAYEADKLDAQLQNQATAFINDPTRNTIASEKVELSRIFSWFKKDFTKSGTLIDYINQYSTVKVNEKATISFMEYNWALNESIN